MGISKKAFELAKSPIGDLIIGLAFGRFSKLLPITRIKETDKVIAFWHPKPFWEKHIVLVPKKAIKSIATLTQEDCLFISEIYLVAKEIVKELGWDNNGYTILVNGGERQDISQIHFHLQSGKQLKQ
jgi:histidine triad (HIT) family protein